MGDQIVTGGDKAAFDEGVRRGADYLAIVGWANYDEASAVYITAPHTTQEVISAAGADEDGGVVRIYDLRRDRDYQLQSPYRQWNTEAGPAEPEREIIEGYYKDFPSQKALTDYDKLTLPPADVLPCPHGPATQPQDPVAMMRASVQRIHDEHMAKSYSPRGPAFPTQAQRQAMRSLIEASFPLSPAEALRGDRGNALSAPPRANRPQSVEQESDRSL